MMLENQQPTSIDIHLEVANKMQNGCIRIQAACAYCRSAAMPSPPPMRGAAADGSDYTAQSDRTAATPAVAAAQSRLRAMPTQQHAMTLDVDGGVTKQSV
jgi:hypothetical protein